MNETLNIILLIIVFVILISRSFYEIFDINKRLKSKNFKEKKQAYKDLKNSGNDSLISDSVEIVVGIFKKIF